MLRSSCAVLLARPDLLIDRLCERYAEFGTSERSGPRGALSTVYGEAVVEATDRGLRMEVSASSETNLAYVKMGLVHHLRAAVGPAAPLIRWTGDGTAGTLPAFFREMTVVDAHDLTPCMRRVVLHGRSLESFAGGGLHVRLLFPPKGRAPVWPRLGEDGALAWPCGGDALTARAYTIREIDLERSEVAIDIRRHEGGRSPGARFAETARPGDLVGMTGPGGGGVPDGRSFVLLGDETALPAIARILEALPGEASALAFIEVDGPQEHQALTSAAALRIEWLHRGPGAASLAAKFEALDWAALPDGTFVWAGCEFADFKAIRRHCRAALKLPRDRHHVVAYWRRGMAGEDVG